MTIFRNFYLNNNTTQRRFVLDIMLTDRIFLETIQSLVSPPALRS